MVTERDENYL